MENWSMTAESIAVNTSVPLHVNDAKRESLDNGRSQFRDASNCVSCARCGTAWHLGAVVEDEDGKKLNFAQLEVLARGTFSAATLRTYSRRNRGAKFFYPHITYERGEVRYSACESYLVILRHSGIDTQAHEAAIQNYDRKAPTMRRVEALERALARDHAELEALERGSYGAQWMRRWKDVNARVERTARWIDRMNRQYGFEPDAEYFAPDRFKSRKERVRAAFPDLTSHAFDSLWREFRNFLEHRGGQRLLRDAQSKDQVAADDFSAYWEQR